MSYLDAAILGLVQGIAEWLPISSSGHLALLHRLFGLEGGFAFDVFLHVSSLLVICIFFRREIGKILAALKPPGTCITGKSREKQCIPDTPEAKKAFFILAATVVTGVIGIILNHYEEALTNLTVIGCGFLGTALFLFAARKKTSGMVTFRKALFVGAVQGIAVLPGLSRSGSTISAAKIAGVEAEEAFSFSFLLAVPAIAGAVILKFDEIRTIEWGPLAAGFVTATATSFLALWLLRKIVLRNRLHWFGWYCLVLSAVTLVLAFQ